jgi:hypothetical protein
LLAAAAALAPAALAVNVHVRVEGKTQTIFGATQPTLSVRATALDALDAASFAGEFYYHVTPSGYVDQIGRYPAAGLSGWVFKVDGALPPVGADKVTLKNGDTVLWYWATFNGPQGPPTLLVKRLARRGCYRALAQNDAGKTTVAARAVFHVDGRSIRAAGGTLCLKRRHGLVRATMAGAVRSNAVR